MKLNTRQKKKEEDKKIETKWRWTKWDRDWLEEKAKN